MGKSIENASDQHEYSIVPLPPATMLCTQPLTFFHSLREPKHREKCVRKPPIVLEGCAHAFTPTSSPCTYALYIHTEERVCPEHSAANSSASSTPSKKQAIYFWPGYFPILQITNSARSMSPAWNVQPNFEYTRPQCRILLLIFFLCVACLRSHPFRTAVYKIYYRNATSFVFVSVVDAI